MTKRNLFAEIEEGLDALSEHRQGKWILRTHKLERDPVPEFSPEQLMSRRKLNANPCAYLLVFGVSKCRNVSSMV